MKTNRAEWHPRVGDVVRLKTRYHATAVYATVIETIKQRSEEGLLGWTTFDIAILTSSGEIVYVTPGCIEEIVQTFLL